MSKNRNKIIVKRTLFYSCLFALIVSTAFMCNPRSEFDYWETMEEQTDDDTDPHDAGLSDSGMDDVN